MPEPPLSPAKVFDKLIEEPKTELLYASIRAFCAAVLSDEEAEEMLSSPMLSALLKVEAEKDC